MLLAFHALTGSDTTSFLAGHSKKTALKVFHTHGHLLEELGSEPLSSATLTDAEKFLCQVYGVSEDTTDLARVVLFKRGLKPELLPPTSDAARLHIMRTHLQTAVWLQANKTSPRIPKAADMGWKQVNGKMVPTLLSMPAIPDKCIQLVTCGCSSGCANFRCRCRKQDFVVLERASVDLAA